MHEVAVLTTVIDTTGICTLPLICYILRIGLSSFIAPEFSLAEAEFYYDPSRDYEVQQTEVGKSNFLSARFYLAYMPKILLGYNEVYAPLVILY